MAGGGRIYSDLVDAIRDVDEPSTMVLWFAMLWLKHTELVPVVREQLEATTMELVRGSRKADLDMYLSVADVELEKTEELKYHMWSTDSAAIEPRKKTDCFKQSREMLSSIEGLPSYSNAVTSPSRAPRE